MNHTVNLGHHGSIDLAAFRNESDDSCRAFDTIAECQVSQTVDRAIFRDHDSERRFFGLGSDVARSDLLLLTGDEFHHLMSSRRDKQHSSCRNKQQSGDQDRNCFA